jgi:uncharacterized LabA/DUF88 family protein
MNKPKIVLLIDLASLKISCEGFKKLITEIEQNFEVAGVKFYGYVAKRNRDFNEYTDAKGYYKETAFASRRRNKLDSQQIIEAALLGMNSTVDAVGLATGEGDVLPMVSYLKLKGKDVYDIKVVEDKYSEAFTGVINVSGDYLRDGYAAPTTKKVDKVKKAPKIVAPTPTPEAVPDSKIEENKYVAEVKKVLSGSSILAKYKR